MAKHKFLLIGILISFILWLPCVVLAAIINANSCSQADVQASIDSAITGDIVIIPGTSGGCIWSLGISIPDNKTITIMGRGYDNTVITGSSVMIKMNKSGSRITGIGFILTKSANIIEVKGRGWRIDHCKFTNNLTTNEYAVNANGLNETISPAGLVDNCIFYNCKVLAYGMGNFSTTSSQWNSDLSLGTDDAVYVEDCTFNYDGRGNCIDSNRAGKYVFRFNNIIQSRIEAHSLQLDTERATRKWEIYNNKITAISSFGIPLFIRGGTGVIFNNEIIGSWTIPNGAFDNRRSYDSIGSAGYCDGTSPWDGNMDSTGWPCRDQIGRSKDVWLWTNTQPYPPQASEPAYLWLNRYNGSINNVNVINNSGDHIKNNRDFYDEVNNFNGTLGTGYGILVNRPLTCTKGVAYWAIDQGDWNKIPGGEQGVLYKCIDTNTWDLYYKPFTYPHPKGKPSPPTDLKIIP